MSRKSKEKRRIKKIIRYTVLTLAVATLIASALMFMQAWERNRGIYDEPGVTETDEIVFDGKVYEPKESIETFLVLGLDKFDNFKSVESYNNDKQADFLMLFVFDDEAKTCTGIQINRDTMVDVNILGVAGNRIDTVRQQIALAHTYGNGRDVSCRNTADSVSSLLCGVKVNHYISLTMEAVKTVNDHIGGVSVRVLNDFSGVDDSLVKGKTVTLKGEQALTYVRARMGLDDSTNVARMKRQRQYMEAFYKKIVELSENNGDFALEALTQIADYLVSDRSITQMRDLADKFIGYSFEGIRTVSGDNLTGEEYMEFYADERSVKEIVTDLFYSEKTE